MQLTWFPVIPIITISLDILKVNLYLLTEFGWYSYIYYSSSRLKASTPIRDDLEWSSDTRQQNAKGLSKSFRLPFK